MVFEKNACIYYYKILEYTFAMKKTNAMRILDKEKIPYNTATYDDDGEHTLERGAAEKLAME